MQESWFYLPSLGIFIIISIFLFELKKQVGRKIIYALISIVLFLLIIVNSLNNYVWFNPETYYAYWNKILSQNYVASRGLGQYYFYTQDFTKAVAYLEKALEESYISSKNSFYVTKKTSNIHTELAIIFYKQKDLEKALFHLQKAVKIWPGSESANFLLGTISREKGEEENALCYYEKALKSNPYNIKTHYNLALLYSKIGNNKKADYHSKIIRRFQPGVF